MREIAFHIKVPGTKARHRREGHQQPVSGEQAEQPGDLAPHGSSEINHHGGQVADGDTLQHTQPTLGAGVERRGGIDGDAQQIKNEGALQRLAEQHSARDAGGEAFGERKREGHAHYPDERGENHVCGGPAVPLRVLQRCVDMAAIARIVDQHHERHGGSAKGVQGCEAGAGPPLWPIWRGGRRRWGHYVILTMMAGK